MVARTQAGASLFNLLVSSAKVFLVNGCILLMCDLAALQPFIEQVIDHNLFALVCAVPGDLAAQYAGAQYCQVLY